MADAVWKQALTYVHEERCALVVAHPGHELRVHGWLEAARPVVFVLTDGSGSTNAGRLHSTSRVLADAGAQPGAIYGRFSDRALYEAVLNQELWRLVDLVHELAVELVHLQVTFVAADAAEGYNPTHDICRWIADAAVKRAAALSGGPLRSYEFPLVARPNALAAPQLADRTLEVRLTGSALDRKLAAAAQYEELRSEVDAALQACGREAFGMEWLTPACSGQRAWAGAQPPFYERHGQDRVDAEVYQRVIRYAQHLAPIAETLERIGNVVSA